MVSAWFCWISGWEGSGGVFNAKSRGAAKAQYWHSVRDYCPDLPFTRVVARRLGRAESSEHFIDCVTRRGMPDLRCGARVKVNDRLGTITGHTPSANLEVLFDEGAHSKYPVPVHPAEVEVIA